MMTTDLKIKMLKLSFTILILLGNLNVYSQHLLNPGFEQVHFQTQRPIGWQTSFKDKISGFSSRIDSLIRHKGKYSFCIVRDSTVESSVTEKVSFKIPAIYEGATIKLIGFLKTEGIDPDGAAGLYIQVEGASGILEKNYMEAKKVTGTTAWKKYAVELSLTDEVKKIEIGGWLKGAKGKVWFDELNVYIEGKELEKTKVYKARLDSSYSKGSGIKLSNLDKRRIKDLQLLGQVWGFLKYHHPSVALGDYNWDYELFKFLPDYLKTTSANKRDQLLIQWINSLGSFDPCTTCKVVPDSQVKMKSDLSWIRTKEIGNELQEKIVNVYNNRNQGKQYYVSVAMGIGNAEFINEDPYEQYVFPDDGFRLLALYRYWNIIRYFFPYRYAIDENWDSVLLEFIPSFTSAGNKLEYRKAVVELIGKVHDTHANLWGRDSVWSNYKGKFIPPIQTKFIENKLVVTNFYHDSLGRQTGVEAGDIITAIDGIATSKLLNARLKFYPASNYTTQLRDLAKDMLRGNSRSIKIEIKRGNEIVTKTIKRFRLDSISTRLDGSYSIPDSCYRLITNDIGYINLGNIESNLLPTMFKKFASTKGLIIDIRNYPSEFVVFSLGNYLMPAPIPFAKFSVANLNQPGSFLWGTTQNVGYNNKDYYSGKIVILVNEITQSQAEYTAMALRTSKNAMVMGSTTAGADGNVSIFYLPGKLRTMISGIGVYYPDGRETQRIGIVPDRVVTPTIAGIKDKKDELLERAVQYILENKN
jgi:hypothetical protein